MKRQTLYKKIVISTICVLVLNILAILFITTFQLEKVSMDIYKNEIDSNSDYAYELFSKTIYLPNSSEVINDIIADYEKQFPYNIAILKKHFIERLNEIDKIVINSPQDGFHIDNILNVSFEGVRGEVLLHALEDYNIFVSTGSACSAKKSNQKNYVLPSIGLKPCFIEGTIRFSFSYDNTLEEIDYTIDGLKKIMPFLRRSKRWKNYW